MEWLASLLSQGFEVFKGFRDAGLLAGLALLVNLLVNLSKLPMVKAWFDQDRQWLRAPLALALGAAGGVLQALLAGHSASEVALAAATGLVAGLGAMGVHEAAQSAKKALG